jgi:hypothetical protein
VQEQDEMFYLSQLERKLELAEMANGRRVEQIVVQAGLLAF